MEQQSALQFNFNTMAGAKLPVHSHLNEQVIRVLKGDLEVHTSDDVYTIHREKSSYFHLM